MKSLTKSLKIICALILLITAISVTTGQNTTTASNTAIVSVYPLKVKATPYELFSINITVTNVENLYAWELKLWFDMNLLIPQLPPIEGPFLKSGGYSTFFAWTYDRGSFMIGATRLGKVTGASGNGTLVTVRFYAFQVGDCLFDLSGTKLWDNRLALMDHVSQDGYYTPPVLADMRQRRAWPRRHHFCITRDKVGVQTLYGEVRNLGSWDCYVGVEFRIVDEFGQPVGVFQAKHVVGGIEARLVPGESVTLSVNLWESRETAWRPGRYYVEATCVYSAGLVLWEYGVAAKNFSFAVGP